jgi:FkbM family methyltransferase
MNRSFLVTLETIIGRRMLWRLGRALYSQAKADFPNDLRSNGECFVQQQILQLYSYLSEKLVVFDVGANRGEWTISMLNQASACRFDKLEIHAFEPIPDTFTLLSKSIANHPLCTYVKLIPLALSSESGVIEMYISSKNGETNSFHLDPIIQDKSVAKVRVERITVQNYCDQQNVGRIGLLKVDAEGHDAEILLGARNLFVHERVTVFQFEYNYRWVLARHFLKDVFDFIRGLPYMLGKITPTHIEFYDGWHPELERYFEGNYVLVHREFIGHFVYKKGQFDYRNTYA